MNRLTARFWADAYLARLRIHDIPAFVVRHGDDTAGAILVKLNTLNGSADLFHRSFDLQSGETKWMPFASGPERDIDAILAKQSGTDPDLWIIEVEDRDGRHFLDSDGLA